MKIFEFMTSTIEGCDINTTILEATKRMRDLNVGAVPVFQNQKVTGLVTDRDIVVRAIAAELNPATTPLGEIMSKELQFCNSNDEIQLAAQIMEKEQVRRLLVKSAEGDVVGIVSLGDIATHVSKDLSGEILQQISQPSHPKK